MAKVRAHLWRDLRVGGQLRTIANDRAQSKSELLARAGGWARVWSMLATPDGAMCATHSMSNAIAACPRCGSFVCGACGNGLCPACRARQPTSPHAACYQCQAQTAAPVSFAWWGGALGPRIFSHVKCGSCGATYNGKTGQSNTTKIAIYIVVVNAIAIAGVILFYS